MMIIGTDAAPVVAEAVQLAVLGSFATRPMPIRRITRAEARRRVEICERIWRILRLEQGWSLRRTCDHLYRYLIAELDGESWEPATRALWVPDHAVS